MIGGDVSDEVDLTGLERGHLCDGVLDHADDDAIEVRQARLEVLVEAVQDQMTALHPLDELERPASGTASGLPAFRSSAVYFWVAAGE